MPTPGYDPIGTVQQAITSLLSTQEPQFIAIGNRLFLSFATILLVWHGIRLMLDRDIVAVSPSSVWRVLGQAGLLGRWNKKPSRKGTGFQQPEKPHEHWHVDVSYINISGTFYYLCSVLDGASRFIVHWEIRETMKESDIEVILQRAREFQEFHRGSSPTMDRSSSPRISRNSSASAG